MTIVTGLTAERMFEMENATVIDGHVDGSGDLILVTKDETEINAGYVVGPVGPAGGGFIICTSTTRPTLTAPEEGKAIYETDTNLWRIWTGTRFKVQERIICTSITRPAMTAADEGTKIYETDSNLEFLWTGTAWVSAFYLPPAGVLEPIFANIADAGRSICDGDELPRGAEGARLFAKWGTMFGPGNGTSTFNKPDLKGFTLAGVGGAIVGALGAKVGATSVALSIAQMPSHDHSIYDPTHIHPVYQIRNVAPFGQISGPGDFFDFGPGANTSPAGTGVATYPNGSGAGHNNVQPTALVNWQVTL